MSILSFRAEVLESVTHKYASSEVSGGGGFVSTTGNGTVYGATAPVSTTVTHHVDQDLWIRNVDTGQERKISLNDSSFSARPGHRLCVTIDQGSNTYERIYNENTKVLYQASGTFNQSNAKQIRAKAGVPLVDAVLLSIPLVNWLIGIQLIVRLLTTPVRAGGYEVARGTSLLPTFLLGLGIFFLSSCVIFFYFDHRIIAAMLCAVPYVFCVIGFIKRWPQPYERLANLIEERAKLHDEALHKLA